MTLTELLSQINGGIKQLNERKERGEDVSAELEKLTGQKAQVESAMASTDGASSAPAGETELDRLRRESRERELNEAAQKAASAMVSQFRSDQAREAERVSHLVQSEVVKQLGQGGGNIDDVVRSVLGQSQGGSRFAGPGSDDAVVDQLTLGQVRAVEQQPVRSSIQIESSKEAKRISETKNLAHFLSIVARVKAGGEVLLNGGEREFIRESQEKAMAEMTNTAGGFLVPREWMPDILGLLRAQTVVRQANPRIVPFAKEMNQTSISTGATAYYRSENANITPSEPTFAEAPLLTPKNLNALVPVSNFLLSDAPEADSIVRADMGEVMGLREDLSFLQGTGAGGEPLGLRNMTGRTQNPVAPAANGFQPTLQQLRAIRNVTRTFNSRSPRWVWFFPPQFISYLEGLVDPNGRYLADSSLLTVDENGQSGRIDGVPFFTTTQIPVNLTRGTATNATYLLLVDASELIIGESQELSFAVSTEASYTPDGGTTWVSAFQATQTLFRATLRHDIAHRRPNHVIVQEGVLV